MCNLKEAQAALGPVVSDKIGMHGTNQAGPARGNPGSSQFPKNIAGIPLGSAQPRNDRVYRSASHLTAHFRPRPASS